MKDKNKNKNVLYVACYKDNEGIEVFDKLGFTDKEEAEEHLKFLNGKFPSLGFELKEI